MVEPATALILKTYQQPSLPLIRCVLDTHLGAMVAGLVRPALTAPPGVALVAYRHSEPPVIIGHLKNESQGPEDKHPGLSKVNRRDYTMIFEVNVANCSFGFQCSLPSKGGTFSFRAAVEVSCEVVDPQAIVEKRIQDAQAVLQPLLVQTMRDISWNYDIRDAAEAEKEINEIAAAKVYDFGIKITRFSASLNLPPSAIESIRNQQQEDERYAQTLQSGIWEILAWHMNHPNDIKALEAIIQRVQQKMVSSNQRDALASSFEERAINGAHQDEPSVSLLGPLAGDNVLRPEVRATSSNGR